MSLTTGTRLGAYEIVSLLGAGGMGEVYRARDTKLQRDVAIKVLPAAFVADPQRVARFEREAQALAALNHPNIAQIYGTEQQALVMEFVDGHTLEESIRAKFELGSSNFELFEWALPIARQIAEGLECAHEKGIIHRDLKPANVKITPDGVVKVLDFGLAKASDPAGATASGSGATMTSPAMTQQGLILGTASYMAPEQARGRAVDKRADIWAFGCVMYECLTGARPFDGDNITDVLAAVVTKDPDWSRLPADTPRSIRTLLMRCLQKDPKQRLHDIADARLELDAPMDDAAELARAGGPPGRTAGRWPTFALVAATVVALLAGTAAGIWWRASRETPVVEWKAERLGGPSQALRPHLSPDGHLLAFLSIDAGQSQISVMKPGTGVWTQLTHDRTHGLAYNAAWSPDGAVIYYDRFTDAPAGVFSVPALGGEERLVIENAESPAPLADGSLLFARQNADRVYQLHRFWPESGKLEPLPVTTGNAQGFDGKVRPLDATRIVLVGRALAATNEADGLKIFDLTSHELRPAGPTFAGAVRSLAVDPRDRSIVVSSRDGSIYRVLRVSTGARVAPAPLLTMLSRTDIDVGPDGTLYVGLDDRAVEILRFTESGANVEQLTLDSTLNDGLAPLPDGRMLVSSQIGSEPRVLVMAPGKAPVKLVTSGDATTGPMTAVAGGRAAIMMGGGDVGVVDVATGRILKRFKTPVAATSLGASPDGSTLYVSGGGSISAITVSTGETKRLTAGDSLAVAPDTGDLIVKLDEVSGSRLVRVSPTGGDPAPIAIKSDLRLIPNPLASGAIRGNKMVIPVASKDSWYWFAAVLDLATGELRRLDIRSNADFHYMAWAADGRVLAYSLGTDAALWKFTR